MKIVIEPKKVTKFFALIVLFLTFVHIAGQCSLSYLGHDHRVFGLVRLSRVVGLFDLDQEGNLPTLYSSMTLLFCSSILALIACVQQRRHGTPHFSYWLGLALVFLFLSVDESVSFHELLGGWLRPTLDASGFLYYVWVIPYSIALFILLLVYLKFWVNLPLRTRILFVIAGTIFVFGALGMELIGGRHFELYGTEDVMYTVITTVEEVLEMSSIVIFIHSLLSYIDSHLDLHIRITSSRNYSGSL